MHEVPISCEFSLFLIAEPYKLRVNYILSTVRFDEERD